ncbi:MULTISPECIES: LysR family transcriptional regulator [unclassified Bradyrhizobium]|uniref:LysR family transcriptional regulator n=1 Tax=unclassified Bradyrhizobium TaxID=2631580 RepID=UPI00247A0135|nr:MULTISPECIES: LysR family transcriptional regulator [unclassified Bradyrhizobium]WGR73147.1 LysR family transcriptional regulator [Bradyrhizobium sp. ISRA426]WGR77987.1 LysR family transcriptional regulator [Bradyrhizobium sp. ISRA430]WGR88388.1 LysR family transcriptional regulator [Bradyrhizobium sp. ISRA432]
MKFKQKLTVRHLRLIEAVGRELSVSRSANALHTSQSAISRGLTEIEELLGARLFERTTRRITPTAVGQSLIWHAQQIMAQFDRAESDFDALSRGVGGTLTVGMMGAFSPTALVEAIKLATEQAPKLTIRIRSNFADGLIADLTSGKCDLIVTHFDVRQFGNEELLVEVLYNEQVVVVAAPGHPFTRRRMLDWADLARERWVLMPIETSTRRAVERNLLMHSQSRNPVFVEALELHYVLSLVRDAGMLTALPTALARWLDRETNMVRCLPVADELSPWAVCVARLRSNKSGSAENLFINCLKTATAQNPTPGPGAQKRKRPATSK